MVYIGQSPVYYKGVIVAYYIVEQAKSGFYYVWRTDYRMRKLRNVGSYQYKEDALDMAARYAIIASL